MEYLLIRFKMPRIPAHLQWSSLAPQNCGKFDEICKRWCKSMQIK